MREQIAEIERRRSPAFVELLLPAYRRALSQTEHFRAGMLYPEWLADQATTANEALGTLESCALRGKAAVQCATAPSKQALAALQPVLTADGATPDEPTVRAFYYHSRVLAYFYEQGALPRERDFEADERRAHALLAQVAPNAAPLNETDGVCGKPPAVLYEETLAAIFGKPKK